MAERCIGHRQSDHIGWNIMCHARVLRLQPSLSAYPALLAFDFVSPLCRDVVRVALRRRLYERGKAWRGHARASCKPYARSARVRCVSVRARSLLQFINVFCQAMRGYGNVS